MAVWDNPDVGLLRDVNGLAKSAPSWADHIMEYVGEYVIVLGLVALVLGVWWRTTRRRPDREEAVSGFAGLLWAPLGAAIALLVNIPIRGFVERPRPFVDHQGLEVLVEGKTDFSFVSDHSTMAMALAVGVFMVHRKAGLLGVVMAVIAGFVRVYMGVHYPTDVIGGLALGMAVSLLLAPLAMALLTPLVRAVASSPRVGALVQAPAVAAVASDAALPQTPGVLPGARAEAASGPSGEEPRRAEGAGRPGRGRRGRDRDLAA